MEIEKFYSKINHAKNDQNVEAILCNKVSEQGSKQCFFIVMRKTIIPLKSCFSAQQFMNGI